MRLRLLTTDLFEGAYLLTQGMELRDIWTDTNGKRSVIFEFSGTNIEVLKNKYRQGEAQANVLTFKRSLNELKDRMFCLLREHKLSHGDRDALHGKRVAGVKR